MASVSQMALDLGEADDTFSVRDLNAAIEAVLARGFRDEVWVRGEIQGLQRSAAGHLYFTLAERSDDGQGESTLRVVLFSRARDAVERYLGKYRMRLQDGMVVRVVGRVQFYGARGQVNLQMSGIDPTYTLGQMAAQRDHLLRQLVAEGLLDRNKRHRMPVAPYRIGLVTSRGSAAWHDLVSELERSGLGWQLVVADTRVQGEQAPAGIAAAFRALAMAQVEVIAFVRGGGSRGDLAALDHEAVARAIAAMPVPVLTGLGHEVDRSVADEVAHAVYKTPTACAAALVERVRSFEAAAQVAWSAIERRSTTLTQRAEQRLGTTARRLVADTHGAVALAGARLEQSEAAIRRAGRVVLADGDRQVADLTRRLRQRAPRIVVEAELRLDSWNAQVSALDPALTLARGWSITRTAAGTLVRDPAAAPEGTVLVTTVAAGEVRSRVEAP